MSSGRLFETPYFLCQFFRFEMYETGNYPTFSDLGKLLANNYDYERKNDNRFIHGVDGDYSIFTNQLNFMFT